MKGLYGAAAEETADMRQLVREIVPEYREAEDVNREAAGVHSAMNMHGDVV